jgi:hypothetical protein
MYGSPYSQMMQQQPQGPMVQVQPMRGIQPMSQDAPPPPKQSGGGLMGGMMSGAMGGGMGGGGGMAMLSDERSKEQIQKLSTQNAALTQALGNKVGPDGLTDERRNWYAEQERKARGTRAPQMSTDLARWASMSGFGDSPAANRVAAQNAALGGGAPAQHSPTGMPAPALAGAVPERTALSEQGALPPTEYPRLPQNTRVAPINAGGGDLAPAAPQRQPTVWDSIQRSNPNLEALDAAYRDLSRGA